MNLMTWVVAGVIFGILSNVIDPEPNPGGVIGAIMLGILGAILGGFIANLVFGVTIANFNITSLAIAIGGSLFLLFIGKAFKESLE